MATKPELKKTGLDLLREPFPAHQISKLPKPTKQQTELLRGNSSLGIRCPECKGWHHKDVVHLDYVGHAALTDRLLDCDPMWTWEPLAMSEHGLPVMDNMGGMWIRLTVCGITRLGYGDAGQKTGGDAIKEVIGDALRNAAMRFGAALDLWHKGDLHVEQEPQEQALDMSPKARASRIADGVAAGDAAGAALALSGFETKELDAVWALLDVKVQEKLTAAWPKG